MNRETKIVDDRLKYRSESKLRQLQRIELRMLKVLDEICERHNLQYYLDWGTFLGAIRHGGFIPWDDDIDLAMYIDDYKKLIPILEKELPEDLFLQTWETDLDFVNVEGIKIRDRYSNLANQEVFGEDNRAGAFIEVFPFYKTPDKKWLQKLQKSLFINLISCRYFPKYTKMKYKVRANISKCVTVFIPFKKLEILIENMYKLTKGHRYRKTLHNSSKNWDFYFEESTIFPLKRYQFEDFEALGPAEYDRYLTMMYGDYMTPPSVENRIQTHMNLEHVKIKYRD